LPGNSQRLCPPPTAPAQASCLAIENLDIPEVPNPNADPLTIKGYAPKDIRAVYHLPDGGAGKTVTIVDAYDSPTVEADLAVYRAAFGLPVCTSQNGCFRKVNQSGNTGSYPTSDTGWGSEIALDVDMVSAACPACKILLVEANSASLDDLGASVDEAVALGASAVSNSYYAAEWPDEAQEESHYNHIGVPITVSSGDGGIGATYPAASRYVTAVGGTVMTGSNGAFQETSGWQKTGRGCSQYISKPWWQSQFKCAGRAITDVSALADPANGVAVYDSFAQTGHLGGWMVVGGTSVGAPIIASAYALAGDFGSRNSAARLYWRYKYLNDIPPVGWDYATGLGSPNGVAAF
jgi:subtilase family serine protease